MHVSALVLFLAFSLTSSLFAQAAAFPPPISSEIAVSEPSFGQAPASRGVPVVASNGTISLAVWTDARSGPDSAIATRIDSAGNILDPLGIEVARPGYVQAVVWDGTDFSVFVLTAGDGTPERITVSPSGVVQRRGLVDLLRDCQFRATGWSGEDARFAYRCTDPTTYQANVTIINAHGERTGRASDFGGHVAAGVSEWVTLKSIGQTGTDVIVRFQRLSRDGALRGTFDRVIGRRALSGMSRLGVHPGGVMLVTRDTTAHDIIAYRFNDDFQFTGQTGIEGPDPREGPLSWYPTPEVVFDGDKYLIAWQSVPIAGKSIIHVVRLGTDLMLDERRDAREWSGTISGITLHAASGRNVLFVQNKSMGWLESLARPLESSEPRPITESATLQSAVNLARSDHGYLVAWAERETGRSVRMYVRRFSPAGAPLDRAPIVVMEEPDSIDASLRSPALIGAGDRYLLAWRSPQGAVLFRRLSAVDGTWLDPEPQRVVDRARALSSNGTDVLIATVQSCPGGSCIATQRVPLVGPMTPSEPVLVSPPGFHNDLTLQSNGNDYLLAWSEGLRPMGIGEVLWPPERILGLRLRADGTRIDREPLLLENNVDQSFLPSVAWNSGAYVVVWSGTGGIRAARVTDDGKVLETDPDTGGTLVEGAEPFSGITATVIAHERGFVLLTRRSVQRGIYRPATWNATFFDATTPLNAVAALPRRAIITHADAGWYGTLAVASGPAGILFAYDRVADGIYGSVPRVFLRFFGEQIRRRAVSRH